jgi:zinc protease
VQAAGKRYAVPAESTLVLVGDRSKIESGIRSLNIGEVIFLDVEGRPVGAK